MQAHDRAVSTERDLRLDFFRGLALWSIFIDHVDWNGVLAQFTIKALGFSDAAEVFIFISGYTAGMVYKRVIERQGAFMAGVRIYHRVWQLYVAHVFLFMQFMATVAYRVDALHNAIYAEEFRAADFLKEPGVAVIKALTLQFQPDYMDILPLYIVLLAVLPFVLVGLQHWPKSVLTCSLGLWVAVQYNHHIALRAYPGPHNLWLFNPFAWQALFFLAAWCGQNERGEDMAWMYKRWVFWIAVGWALAAFLIRLSWMAHWLYDPFPALFSRELWPRLSKTDLSPFRFANVLALALVVAHVLPARATFLGGRVAQLLVMCGRHSLHIFCLGVLLATIGRLIINEYLGGLLLQGIVLLVGIALMIGTAALMDWFQAEQRQAGAWRQRPAAADRGG
jgi:hypothetical protein